MDLDFITDSALRQRIKDSVEYIYTTLELSKDATKKELFRAETYRVIVLYIASVIEAILFYLYSRRGIYLQKEEYKKVHLVGNGYVNTEVSSGKVIIATVKTVDKKESEIGFKELVIFLEAQKILKKETSKQMLSLYNMRNTFHLRKEQELPCTVADVERYLQLLLYTLTNVAKFFTVK